ncbi:MAG: riboflavin synthase [Clostridia bacterium]|nr:riboflavin synthase [Clostridia bacterium]
MFTGIVEEVGIVSSIRRSAHSSVLTVAAEKVTEDAEPGGSIAVNGACLTVTAADKHSFTTDIMHETINRTTLWQLKAGSRVNLERALPACGRFGGHIVTGHIDGAGRISDIRHDDIAVRFTVLAEPLIMRYIVEKGSVAIDGISLTVTEVFPGGFSVSVIPHTVHGTALGDRHVGDCVNLENDIVGKYVEKLMSGNCGQKKDMTRDFLINCGY